MELIAKGSYPANSVLAPKVRGFCAHYRKTLFFFAKNLYITFFFFTFALSFVCTVGASGGIVNDKR